MKLIKTISLNFLLVAALFLFSASNIYAAAAPDFSLPGSSGKTIKLSELKGKWVVLEWFNDGCPYVKKHYESGNIPNLQKKYTAQGVVWLTVLSSAPTKQGHRSAEEVKTIMTQWKGAPTDNLLDPEGKVGQLYGAKTTPHLFIINPKGEIVYQGAIDSIPSTEVADIAKAENYVDLGLSAALANKPITTAQSVPYGCSVKY